MVDSRVDRIVVWTIRVRFALAASGRRAGTKPAGPLGRNHQLHAGAGDGGDETRICCAFIPPRSGSNHRAFLHRRDHRARACLSAQVKRLHAEPTLTLLVANKQEWRAVVTSALDESRCSRGWLSG